MAAPSTVPYRMGNEGTSVQGNTTKGLATPGAYLLNTSTGSFPIFGTITNFNNVGFMNDCDDAYLIMPGFQIIVYTDYNWSESSWTGNNSTGTVPICLATSYVNRGSSCKLYYGSISDTNLIGTLG